MPLKGNIEMPFFLPITMAHGPWVMWIFSLCVTRSLIFWCWQYSTQNVELIIFYSYTKVIRDRFDPQMASYIKCLSRTLKGTFQGQKDLGWPWCYNKKWSAWYSASSTFETKKSLFGSHTMKIVTGSMVVAGKNSILLIVLQGHEKRLS